MQEIVKWSASLPSWQRDALRRLCQKDQLTNEDMIDLEELCLRPHTTPSNVLAKASEPLTPSHIRHDARGQVVALRRITDVANVNALAEGQVLKFAETGLTIVFGGNASGKSGYTRILKKACRARDANAPILPNVYIPTPGKPASATLVYSIGGRTITAEWVDGRPSDNALSAISVFDSACALVHVEKTNDVAYTPTALQLLARLADVCRVVRTRLANEQEKLQQTTLPSISHPKSRAETRVGKLLESLSASTDMQTVETLARLSADERLRADTLRRDLAKDLRMVATELRLGNQVLRGNIAKVDGLNSAADEAASENLRVLIADSLAKNDAARIAAKDLFSAKEPLPNVGSNSWRALWEAARKYSESEAYSGQPFPVTDEDARCVLCQQELEADGSSRLNRFEDYVRANTQKLAHEATLRVNSQRMALQDAQMTQREQRSVVAQVSSEFDSPFLAAELRRFLAIARWRRRLLLRASNPNAWPDLPPLPLPLMSALTTLTETRSKRITEIQNAVDTDVRRRLEEELKELEDCIWLSSVIADVRREINRKKGLTVLVSAIQDTDTRSITTKSTALAETLVTTALRDRFANEVTRLGMGRPRIEMVQTTSEYGVPKFKVSLIASPSADVGFVLSEGEHRCIGLAGFLSELATADDQSGIVFDDPVSSLDHEHRQIIAKRLVEESQNRQVIVFTHDIVFLSQLAEQARTVSATPLYQSVARGTDRAGFCSSEPPLNRRPVLDALCGLEKHLKNISYAYTSGDIDKWWREAKSIAESLRELWERAVEQVLSPVYSRFEYKVHTAGLVKIVVLTDSDCKTMRSAFRRCSALQHSEPAAVGSAPPTPQILQDEIDELRRWLVTLQQRQDAVK